MKKFFVIVVTISLCSTSKAQDTVNIYAGITGICSINTKDAKDIQKFANFRVGAQYTKVLSKKTSVKTWITYDPGSLVLFEATATTKLGKDFAVRYGFGPTPATMIRPYPLSVDGQFEFTSESIPPGGALGGYIAYKNTKVGVYTRNGMAEYHFGQNIGKLQLDGWYSKSFAGGTAQLSNDWLYLMATVTDDGRQALATAIRISKKSSWKVVHDFGVKKGEITNNLVGLLYPMKLKGFTDSRIGCAYDFKQHAAGVFWLIGLDR